MSLNEKTGFREHAERSTPAGLWLFFKEGWLDKQVSPPPHLAEDVSNPHQNKWSNLSSVCIEKIHYTLPTSSSTMTASYGTDSSYRGLRVYTNRTVITTTLRILGVIGI